MNPSFASLAESGGVRPQKAYAAAFVGLTLALAGCASGLGSMPAEQAVISGVSRVEEGQVLASRDAHATGGQAGYAYTVRLRSGELASIAQTGGYAIADGAQVLVQYGQTARLIPQGVSILY